MMTISYAAFTQEAKAFISTLGTASRTSISFESCSLSVADGVKYTNNYIAIYASQAAKHAFYQMKFESFASSSSRIYSFRIFGGSSFTIPRAFGMEYSANEYHREKLLQRRHAQPTRHKPYI